MTSVELIDVRHARAIDRYVQEHPLGSPFHETRWLDLVRTVFDFATQTLVAWEGREIRGVLPLGLVAAPITGRRLVSVPYGVYGGILADGPEAIGALDEAAGILARRLAVRYVETRYLGAGPTQHHHVSLYETYRADLPQSRDDVYGTIPRKARAEARKARDRHQMTLVEGAALFRDFYRLYCLNKRSLGSPVFRPGYFRQLLDLYGPRALLHGVEHEGRIVAAVLSLASADTIFPYYSGSEPESGRLGASNFLYAALMEHAVDRGFRIFDFGRSRAGSGPAAFKQHMGFSPQALDYQFLFPFGGKPPEINPSNPAMKLPQKVLSSLPMWAARLVGHSVMRHVP
ncbi:MAG: FemAB family PEP-CTERM system-associated protein [Planctomycetes bacterium]|nr:FemAB family PEP-CTERM system-associated protein [Planctomycetota bacterium]